MYYVKWGHLCLVERSRWVQQNQRWAHHHRYRYIMVSSEPDHIFPEHACEGKRKEKAFPTPPFSLRKHVYGNYGRLGVSGTRIYIMTWCIYQSCQARVFTRNFTEIQQAVWTYANFYGCTCAGSAPRGMRMRGYIQYTCMYTGCMHCGSMECINTWSNTMAAGSSSSTDSDLRFFY